MKGLNWRIFVTLLCLALYVLAVNVYGALQGPLEAQIAVGQIADDAVTYAAARAASTEHLVRQLINWAFALLLLVVWVPYWANLLIRSLTHHNETSA